MLRQAQEVMDKGLMTPAEMEAHLVAHLTVNVQQYSCGPPAAHARIHALGDAQPCPDMSDWFHVLRSH